MKNIIIAAMTPNRVIGCRGRLPWHLPEEYQHFLDSVRGKTMVMGRKSWEVFGGDVGSQVNIVLTAQTKITGALTATSLEAALTYAEHYQHDCFIAGGAQVYQTSLTKNLVDEMWLSEVKLNLEGDAFFPEFEPSDWDLTLEEDRSDYWFRKWIRSIKPTNLQ